MYKLGIDIGASHIGLGLFEEEKLIKKEYIPYKRPLKIFNKIFLKQFTKRYIRSIINSIDHFIEKTKIDYIGIGCPGGVDQNNAIFYGSKALVTGQINFKKELKKYNAKIYVDNDCNCAAIAEAVKNSLDEFLMITIGTGVGFSLVKKEKNKILISKDERIWQILELNKVPNTKHEKYISSFKKLSKKYNELQNKNFERNAIFDNFNTEESRQLIDEYIENFVIGISIINEKQPIKNICIGGSFSLYHQHYLKQMQAKLKSHNIIIAQNNNDSGIIGATYLPIDRY